MLAAAIALTLVGSASAAEPKCYGAASRDPFRQCRNPKLADIVKPTPDQAALAPNGACEVIEEDGLLTVCASGVAPEAATATVALVGDSHAKHWRAGLEVVARAQNWRLLSVTQTGCPFSAAPRNAPKAEQERCTKWNEQASAWFTHHPEVSIVFAAQLTGGSGVVTPAGKDEFTVSMAGYRKAWDALPASVAHVVVIRDTPKIRYDTFDCIERAIDAHAPAGTTCAVSRAAALDRDPAARAAVRAASPRYGMVDLNRFMCSVKRCYPVIGGALVFKDPNHLTLAFATSLGPFLLRHVRHLMAKWPVPAGRPGGW